MASELCMNCFSVKGQFEVCPYCGYVEGTPPVQPHCLTPGTILGNHFIVGTVIGFGGFGITYKCYDTTLGITVAAKEFYPGGLVNRSPGESKVGLLSGERRQQFQEQKTRFLMEARSVAQFGKAKDIVNIFDYFEENGTAYIIMEYIDGILLKDYLEKQGAMEPNVAMSVIMPIIEAVKKIHSKGIIHRDISPDNIFITDENSIKIFDFGAAQLNDSKEGMAGEKIIKAGYSAPEQYRDKSRQGFYTDIYSVGAIMYQLLTGRKPIESTEREYKDTMKSPMELGIKVNSNVDKAVMEAMAVQPELRYQGIQQFEDALRNKRVAEYPKDKIKKRRMRRTWIIATAASLVMVVALAIVLTKTVFKGESEIFDSSITKDTIITIWVENEDQKTQLDELARDGLKKANDGSSSIEDRTAKQVWEKFWKENEHISVEVSIHEDMAEDLANTPENELPNMYMTDHVPGKLKDDLVSLEGVYHELDVENDYAYLVQDTYEKEFPKYTELPTGLDTPIVYICSLKENENNTMQESSDAIDKYIKDADDKDKEENKTAVLEPVGESDLIGIFRNQPLTDSGKSEVLSYNKYMIMGVVAANDPDWIKYLKNDGTDPSCSELSEIQKINQTAYADEYMLNSDVEAENDTDENDESVADDNPDSITATQQEEIYGNNIVAGVAFRKKLTKLAQNNEGTINKIEDFQSGVNTYLVDTDKDQIPIIYSERYGIRSESDTTQIKACKRMLYVMMQGPAQAKKINSGVETTLPIRKKQLESFATTHGNMPDIYKIYADHKGVVIVGSVTGDMYQYITGVQGVTDSSELFNYCNTYRNQYLENNESNEESQDNKDDNKDMNENDSTDNSNQTEEGQNDTEEESSDQAD